jgi:hypothetical protein
MVVHICELCNKIFNKKSTYINHINNKKKPCINIMNNNNEDKDEIFKKLLEQNNILISTIDIQKDQINQLIKANDNLVQQIKLTKNQTHGKGTRCNEQGCNARARDKTNKCVAHGGGKRCNEQGCNTSAIGKTNKCIAHGGGKRCNEQGCNTSAIGKTNKCIAHGGGKRCNEQGCNSSARDKTNKCKAHGGGKRCNEQGCNSSAQDKTNKCKAHGGGKRCNEQGCNASARDKTDKCVAHGGGKRCNEQGCNVSAVSKTDKCVAHGGGKRCPNCIDWVDSRSGCVKYDGYCATCFKRIFPNDERSKIVYTHTKEIMVRNAINLNFEGFIHDTPLYTGGCDCTHRRRIDHRKLFGNTILAIETDEFGHRSYDQKDEEIRYDDVFMIYSGKWIFIRFNPDNNISKIDIDDKINILIDKIKECISRIKEDKNTELIEIYKLYC